MPIKTIAEKLASLEIYEKRCVSDDFCEMVFLKKDIMKWDEVLTGELGPAVKPLGEAPTKEDTVLTEDYGGIFKNQVLYKKDVGGVLVAAMLWPWQNNTHVTLKMFVKKSGPAQENKKSFLKKFF
ncbi:MAG: hypothetical protein HQL30_11130 [Candidatus Omnitrophica bacterium]|nr:hypothetical protein [Candidatus Omnitrophota bacterium]